MNQNGKVSVIVPVYNAEKYLGYCLNSLLSQTYTNWEAILINDGSFDGSLEICKNYAELDSRFRVFTKENGGVSSARNYGLQFVQGEYLEFLDSDDCMDASALEKQVRVGKECNSQLVVMDALIVDFEMPEFEHILLQSGWLQQSPCCLDRTEFREREMRLIWHTALLESPWAKLYSTALWMKLKLKFPTELSLGEDFVTNLKYYSSCDKIAFLNECGYYYGNSFADEKSLSHRYREDLFELKMRFMREIEKSIGAVETLSEPEQDAFYCYGASSGLRCVEDMLLRSGKNAREKRVCLERMMDDKLFAQCLRNASYIPEAFLGCRKKLLYGHFSELSQVADLSELSAIPELPAGAFSAEEDRMEGHHAGVINKLLRKGLRFVGYRLPEPSRLRERLLRWEDDICQRGMKDFVKVRLQKGQTERKKQQEIVAKQVIRELQTTNQELAQCMQTMHRDVTQRMQETDEHVAAHVEVMGRELERHIQESNEHMAASMEMTSRELEQHVREVSQQVAERLDETSQRFEQRVQKMDEQIAGHLQTISEEQTRNRERIEGDLWNMEQRLSRARYLWEINDLRQRKKAIMLATAEHQNIGDSAITLAEQQLLSSQFPDYYQVEISTYEFARKEAYLHAIVNPQDILFLNGGGNIGDVYPEEEQFHQTIVEQFPNNRIVVFPQTISFRHLDGKTLRDSQRAYNGHRDLTMYLRGRESLEFARTYFPNVKSVLMPDVVHLLQTEYTFPRSGALMCIREDGESSLDEAQREMLCSLVKKMFQNVEYTTNIHPEDVTRDIRGLVVRQELMRFAKHQVVITDRLHGMIFSVITGTPCVVLSSFNQKIREYYEAFLKGTDGVIFLGSNLDGVEEAIRMALKDEKVKSPALQKELLAISK